MERPRAAAAFAQRRRRSVGGEPGRAWGTHRRVSAVSAEIAGGTLPEKRFSPRLLRRSEPVQHARMSAERPHGRRRGVQRDQPGERRDARGDRAGEAVVAQPTDRAQRSMRPRRRWTAHAQLLRFARQGEPGRAKGTHMCVSAVSAEIAGGTLPEKRFSSRTLRHSVPVQHARVGWETARAAARRTGRPAG